MHNASGEPRASFFSNVNGNTSLMQPKSRWRGHHVLAQRVLSKMSTPQYITKRELDAATGKAWVVYHMAASVAQLQKQRSTNPAYAHRALLRIAMDIHYFVLAACNKCLMHHLPYLSKLRTVAHSSRSEDFDAERFVFDLHNDVNVELGKRPIDVTEFSKVRSHYRNAVMSLGSSLPTATALSTSIHTLQARYCYQCGS